MMPLTLFRAVVEPSRDVSPYTERIVFVEACNREDAARRITLHIAAIDDVPADQVSFYNLDSKSELIAHGVSDDLDLRIFETGWRGNKVECWVEAPMFLVRAPEPYVRRWASLPKVSHG